MRYSFDDYPIPREGYRQSRAWPKVSVAVRCVLEWDVEVGVAQEQEQPRQGRGRRKELPSARDASAESQDQDQNLELVEEIREPRPNQELAELVMRRIYVAYGGNQSAFARATGLRQQYIANLLAGKVGIPEEPKRTVLAQELGIPRKAFFVMAGELEADEIDGPWQAALTRPMSSTEVQIAEILRDLPNDYVRPVWELVQKFSEVAQAERSRAEAERGPAPVVRPRTAAPRGRPTRK